MKRVYWLYLQHPKFLEKPNSSTQNSTNLERVYLAYSLWCLDSNLLLGGGNAYSVRQVLNLVDAHKPVLSRVRLFDVLQAHVLLSNDISASAIKAGLVVAHSCISKAVVAHLVHQTVQHRLRSLCANAVLSRLRKVVSLLK